MGDGRRARDVVRSSGKKPISLSLSLPARVLMYIYTADALETFFAPVVKSLQWCHVVCGGRRVKKNAIK